MRFGIAIFIISFLLIFGGVKLKFEHDLSVEHRRAYFHGAKLNLGMREQIGQLAFLSALSGFRSLVADILWIQAHTAWERTEWGRLALILNNVTTLQPRSILFWDMATWHMAWNASVAAFNNPKQPREALRIKAQREYFELGKDFLIRGIQNNPDRYQLYCRLGDLYRDKFKDHCAASEQYRLVQEKFPDTAPSYNIRFIAFELALCPEREQEAYDLCLELYNMGKKHRVPTLKSTIKYLEEKLNIPQDQRVSFLDE